MRGGVFTQATIAGSRLRSKRFRAVLEQRGRNESQRPRKDRAKNGARKRAGRGWGERSKIRLFLGLSLLRNQTEKLATQVSYYQAGLI